MGWFKKSEVPALTRWYLFRTPWFGVKLHKIKGDNAYHTHPWWGVSFILGYYDEAYEDGTQKRKWLFNIISPWRAHKVIVTKPVWTLFINGPRVNENWRWGDMIKPWRGEQDGFNPSGGLDKQNR